MKKGNKMKPELIVATCATFIALLAFCVSIFQLHQYREQIRISRMPLITVRLGTETGGYLSFGIENEGNGAAFIEEIELTVDEKPVELHMLLTKLFGEGKQFISQSFAGQLPTIIRANSTKEIFRIGQTGEGAITDVQLMHEFAKRVGIRIRSRPLKVSDERNLIDLRRLAEPSNEGFRAK